MKILTLKKILASTAGTIVCLSLFGSAALADTVILDKEKSGHSLHDGGINMVLYYEKNKGSHTVVATYATKENPAEAYRFKVSLSEQARVHYFVPGSSKIYYQFERSGDKITISTVTQSQKHALLQPE